MWAESQISELGRGLGNAPWLVGFGELGGNFQWGWHLKRGTSLADVGSVILEKTKN